MTEETSETVARLAGRILGLEQTEDIQTRLPYLELLAAAKTLAGSALTQHEDRASSDDQPTGDAPAPEVMREELINHTLARTGGKLTRHKAEELIDGILLKQMRYYAQMAEPELTASVEEQMAVVQELGGLVGALITQGAAFTQFMSPEKLTSWQSVAQRTRASLIRMAEMFS